MSDPIPATTESQFSDFATLINNNFIDFNIIIATYTGRGIILNNKAVKELVITDTIKDFFASGYLVLDNSYGAIERLNTFNNSYNTPSYYTGSNFNTKGSKLKNESFLFQGDSADILSVKIMPKLSNSNFNNNTNEAVNSNFLMTYTFAIYKIEDISGDSVDEKFKKLSFWDQYYDVMRQKNSYFSTSECINQENILNLSNNERGTTTGNALSSLLSKSLEPIFKEDLKFGNFDTGASKIFFTSPASYTDADSLNYILDHHVCSKDSNYDHPLLRLERYPKQFKLTSLKTLFENAVLNSKSSNSQSGTTILGGSEFLETYKIVGFADTQSDGANLQFELNYDPTLSPFLGTLGAVKSYTFDEMDGNITRQLLSPRIVHTYDSEDKTFCIDSFDNSMEEVNKAFEQNYVKPFGNNASMSFKSGKLRDTFQNIQNTLFLSHYSDPVTKFAQGRTQLMFDILKFSNVLKFKVRGSTHRQAGKFILVTREDSVKLSDFDSKILGVYFIVQVNHIFSGVDYENEVIAVKPYYLNDIFGDSNTL